MTAAPARPRIGVTCGYEEPAVRLGQGGLIVGSAAAVVGLDYTAGVEEAGGLPLVIPVPYRIRCGGTEETARWAEAMASDILAAVDGLLLTGGDDIDPEYFGQAPAPALGPVEPARDLLELALTRAALARGVPVLGICRGIQVLAVAAGGTLHQDLADATRARLKHRQSPSPRWARTHYVRVEPGTLLAELVGAGDLKVNSFHHQAVHLVPDGFRVSARAPDGVVEAIESAAVRSPGGPGATAPAAAGSGAGRPNAGGSGGATFVLGVQWHPENLWSRDPVFLNLFRGLVEAARRSGGSSERSEAAFGAAARTDTERH